jgi:hypothetical protein
MKQAFTIMQIGNEDLDKVYHEVIEPALKECDFDPKRVDKHNEGGLLKSEIINFLESSDIIIADLTNERPNCYLEVGYAMGLDKFSNLILTAQENHDSSSPNYDARGPKIHFDLAGYEILFWDPKNLKEFKNNLIKRIRRRIKILPSSEKVIPEFDNEWFARQNRSASEGHLKTKIKGYMDVWISPLRDEINISQGELLKAANNSQIHTFGWPIGVVLNNENDKPKVRSDGIWAEVVDSEGPSYDYWALKKNCSFYLLQTYFEDMSDPEKLFLNTRIVRITEVLLYAAKLFSNLGFSPNYSFKVKIMHAGLNGRILDASSISRSLSMMNVSTEHSVTTDISTSIQDVESNLENLVEIFTGELFIIFDFFELDRSVLDEIVNKFVEGKVV